MNCKRLQEKFTELADGTLPATATATLQAHLAACPDCRRALEEWQQFTTQFDTLAAAPAPSPRLRDNFYAMLESAESIAPTNHPFALPRNRIEQFLAAIVPTRPAFQLAAAALLFTAGLLLGRSFLQLRTDPVTPVETVAQAEVEELRAQVHAMGRLTSASLLQQRSTGDRLRAVLALRRQPQLDRPVLTDLVSTLALDPSVNVRLTTLDTLSVHSADPLVRAGIAATLPREPAPLVQLAMIDLLADSGDPAARPVLVTLSRDPAADANVRAAARAALYALGQSPTPRPATSADTPL